MKSMFFGALLPGLLVACASRPPSPDREAQDASARLVNILAPQNLLAASKSWPIANDAQLPKAREHAFTSAVPQAYLPPLGGDLPHFWVVGSAGQREFWIRKSEGIAGASTVYGPLMRDGSKHPIPSEHQK